MKAKYKIGDILSVSVYDLTKATSADKLMPMLVTIYGKLIGFVCDPESLVLTWFEDRSIKKEFSRDEEVIIIPVKHICDLTILKRGPK